MHLPGECLQGHSSFTNKSTKIASILSRAHRGQSQGHTKERRENVKKRTRLHAAATEAHKAHRPRESVASQISAFAPATVANLGPGFDWLGCAVEVPVLLPHPPQSDLRIPFSEYFQLRMWEVMTADCAESHSFDILCDQFSCFYSFLCQFWLPALVAPLFQWGVQSVWISSGVSYDWQSCHVNENSDFRALLTGVTNVKIGILQGEGDTVTIQRLEGRPGEVLIESIKGDGGRLSLVASENCAGIAALETIKLLGKIDCGISLTLHKVQPEEGS